MTHETSGEQLRPLDEDYFQTYVDTAYVIDFSGEAESRKVQKELFVSGRVRNPSFDYPYVSEEALDNNEMSLLIQRLDVLENEPNPVVRQAYHWMFNERIAEVRMARATLNGDMSRFSRYNEFINGLPNLSTYAMTVEEVREKAKKAIEEADDDYGIMLCASSVLAMLPSITTDRETTSLPDKETISPVHEQTIQYFSEMINLPEGIEELDAEALQALFNRALATLGDEDWEAIIDNKTSRTSIRVNQSEKRIKLPPSRQVSAKKAGQLVVHEVGTHTARSINGAASSLQLLSRGLDRYVSGEEGIATMREQALVNKVTKYSGDMAYISIGLALGLDGKPRDFRDTYEVLKQVYLLNNLVKKEASYKDALIAAQNSAWNRASRTFMGTDCKTPGVCKTRDIGYRDGNIRSWDLARDDASSLNNMNIGKYDPTNPRHIWVLKELGILTEED